MTKPGGMRGSFKTKHEEERINTHTHTHTHTRENIPTHLEEQSKQGKHTFENTAQHGHQQQHIKTQKPINVERRDSFRKKCDNMETTINKTSIEKP